MTKSKKKIPINPEIILDQSQKKRILAALKGGQSRKNEIRIDPLTEGGPYQDRDGFIFERDGDDDEGLNILIDREMRRTKASEARAISKAKRAMAKATREAAKADVLKGEVATLKDFINVASLRILFDELKEEKAFEALKSNKLHASYEDVFSHVQEFYTIKGKKLKRTIRLRPSKLSHF